MHLDEDERPDRLLSPTVSQQIRISQDYIWIWTSTTWIWAFLCSDWLCREAARDWTT